MSELVVVVHMLFQRGATDEGIEILSSVVEKNQQEPGCIKCALHRDVEDLDVLLVVERWESREAYDNHLEQPHIRELTERAAPVLAGIPRLSISETIPVGDPAKGTI